jgi:GNAT superfamily N-acetyltransferase
MPRVDCVRTSPVVRTARVKQLEGLFDMAPAERSERRWSVALPLEERAWQIGLIVGPSGSGKTTLARELFGDAVIGGFDWPEDRSIVDAFPAALSIRGITQLLSSVGFSSPPSWLRPYAALSNGEQFRVTLARALAEQPELAVVDEFTSVVDRTVAQIGSAAVAKAVRVSQRRFVGVSCHYDIVAWLQPDWVFDPSSGEFQWRSLHRRPEIELEIFRAERRAWRLFETHHYLSGTLNAAARCFLACVQGRPAAFVAVLSHPAAGGGFWREHRCVCLPDFQGVGIGNALSEYVASLFAATGKRYCSTTGNPAMIRHRAKSPLWKLSRPPSFTRVNQGRHRKFNRSAAIARWTAGFRYAGPARRDDAAAFGLLRRSRRDE